MATKTKAASGKTWVVLRDGSTGGGPTGNQFLTKEAAAREAQKRAARSPGTRFIVFEAVMSAYVATELVVPLEEVT